MAENNEKPKSAKEEVNEFLDLLRQKRCEKYINICNLMQEPTMRNRLVDKIIAELVNTDKEILEIVDELEISFYL